MAVLSEHAEPIGKEDSLDTWRKRGRMPIPSRDGRIIDLIIVAIYETTAVNGLPLDLLIEVRKTVSDPVKRFGVILSENPPDWASYHIPILWREDNKAGVGR